MLRRGSKRREDRSSVPSDMLADNFENIHHYNLDNFFSVEKGVQMHPPLVTSL